MWIFIEESPAPSRCRDSDPICFEPDMRKRRHLPCCFRVVRTAIGNHNNDLSFLAGPNKFLMT